MTTTQTQNQNAELETLVTEIRESWAAVRELPDQITGLQSEVANLRRASLTRPRVVSPRSGSISDECARALAAQFILQCERRGMLDILAENSATRDTLMSQARETFGITAKSALTTTDIPLPSQYSGELRELISQFGVARKHMMPFPIGKGTARPARMGTRPAFASIAMSAAIGEKSPTLSFASLESHKIGGLVRLPREIDEQSIVPMGHYLARYGAVEFARAEDTWAFLADGSGTYESVSGIVQLSRDNGNNVTLAATKTKPSDVTGSDIRNLRAQVNKAALNGRVSAYYMDSTWEVFLPTLNSADDPYFYVRLPDGSARLDGYPIVWTDVLQAYSTSAAADTAVMVFGALSFWWFGEHGHPRIDTNDAVFFANDQLAVRFIEEIDFDYAASDAAAALITAAS